MQSVHTVCLFVCVCMYLFVFVSLLDSTYFETIEASDMNCIIYIMNDFYSNAHINISPLKRMLLL